MFWIDGHLWEVVAYDRRFHIEAIYLFIYQLFWTQAFLEGMYTNVTQVPYARCHPYSIPQPVKVGHTTGVYDPYSFRIVMWVLLRPTRTVKSVKVLWDGTYGFSFLFEKTRKSNHLQSSLQRQHFLLSYLKTLSVGPVGVRTRGLPLGRPVLSQLS